jgi:hypothetical protein
VPGPFGTVTLKLVQWVAATAVTAHPMLQPLMEVGLEANRRSGVYMQTTIVRTCSAIMLKNNSIGQGNMRHSIGS